MKKAFVSLGLAVALAAALVTGGSVATAKPAQAYSGSYDYYTYAWCHIHYFKWRNYNWYEETFLWKKDRYEVVAIERVC